MRKEYVMIEEQDTPHDGLVAQGLQKIRWAEKRFVVFGYGSVGLGIACTLRRLGGQVTVVEVDPIII